MKKILLDARKNFYKSNLHCHSTYSDGKMTVKELKERYKSEGYSVLAITDHEFLVDNSHLNDDDFLTITSCELGIKEFENISSLKKKDMKVCHLNIYAKTPDNTDTPCYNSVYNHYTAKENEHLIHHSCGEYKREYTKECINEMIKTAVDNGFLVSYNHPSWSLENATDYIGYKNLWAVEIYNHSCYLSGLYEYDINVYDDLLRSGEKLGCTASDDSHTMKATCGGYVMINADKLEYETIIKALENYDFYASTGPVIKELYVEDGKAYLTFEKGEYATMTTKGRRVEKQEAQIVDGENKVCFNILPEDAYIRFAVYDKYGKRAYTCAYFTKELL